MGLKALLAAAAVHVSTPIPVVIKGAVPEVIRSMPPQVVASMPPVVVQRVLEGPNPWLAFWGPLGVAFVALCVACFTLWKIFDQIGIANKQIALADEQILLAKQQLKLAEDELGAVKDDFALSQKMFEQSNRRPDLRLQIVNQGDTIEDFQDSAYRLVPLRFNLQNFGTKVAHNVQVDYFMPQGVGFTHPNFHSSAAPTEMIGTTLYERYSHGDGRLRVPINGFYHWEWGLWLDLSVNSTEFLYRIYDDEYGYPEGWGRAAFDFEPWRPVGSPNPSGP